MKILDALDNVVTEYDRNLYYLVAEKRTIKYDATEATEDKFHFEMDTDNNGRRRLKVVIDEICESMPLAEQEVYEDSVLRMLISFMKKGGEITDEQVKLIDLYKANFKIDEKRYKAIYSPESEKEEKAKKKKTLRRKKQKKRWALKVNVRKAPNAIRKVRHLVRKIACCVA
jgi:hypothetical protein